MNTNPAKEQCKHMATRFFEAWIRSLGPTAASKLTEEQAKKMAQVFVKAAETIQQEA